MTETELIQKIQKLKQIKPREEWVVLAKNRMFDIKDEAVTEPVVETKMGLKEILAGAFRIMNYRPAMAGSVAFALIFVVFIGAQNSLPGDSLYSIKKITEQMRVELASNTEKPKVQLELAEQRLTDLFKITDANMGKNLAPAIEEFERTAKSSAAALNQMTAIDGYKVDQEIVAVIESLEEKTKILEDILAVKIDTDVLEESADSYYRKTEAEQQIADLENRTLTAEQEILLEEAKQYYEQGDYSQALETILLLNNSQSE